MTDVIQVTIEEQALGKIEALAVLHRFYDAYAYKQTFTAEQFEQNEQLRTQAYEALRVLTQTFHGPHPQFCFMAPICRICYLRYGDHFVKIKHEIIEYILRDCCGSCLEQLRESGQLFLDEKAEVLS